MSYTTKYKFTKFDDMKLDGEYNFYGIIFDAAFPIYSETPFPHYECTLKLIDDSLDISNDFNDEDYITLIIKSQNKEEIPFIHFIGDVIRVISGIYQNKKKRYIYLNFMNEKIIEKSYWRIYRNNIYDPLMCSKHDFSFDFNESSIISYLFEYYLFISNKLKYPKKINLIDRNEKGSDNDALVMIVNKTELDDQLVFDIQDDTDGCQLHTYKYFNFIEVNDVVRIRAFKIFNRNVLILNPFSNILKIPQFSSYYKIFMNKLTTKLKEIQNLQDDIPMFVTNSKEKSPISPLMYNNDSNKKLICKVLLNDNENYDTKKFEEITSQDKKFLMNLNILEIYPKPLYNFVNILCDGCKTSYSITDITLNPSGLFRCEKCKSFKNGILHFNTTLQCRETNMSNQIVTLYLCSFDGEGNGFFGIPPCDAYRNSNDFQKLGIIFKGLCNPGNYVNVLVQQYKGGILRIVGNYEKYIKFN